MLVYIGFIILTFAGSGLAGHKPTKCKNPEHSCPKNEHYTRNNPRCIRTCANKWVPNSDDCKSFTGCVCNDGLVRLNDDGTGPCVSERECPNKCKDKNAMFKKCPNPCPLSCDHPFSKVCSKMCLESGCECAPGFILDCNDSNGKCIRPEDCPKPIRCPKHSRYVINDNQCPKTCGNRLLPNSDVAGICAPFTGCACKHGYVRKYDNATGPCIKEDKCPPIPTECGVNEEPTSCAIVCPPQTCDSIFSSYYCLPTECEPGCDCLNEFLRNDDGICIPSYDCFKPDPIECNGPNEVYSDCVYTCPPQSCESLFVNYLCAAEITCTEGCRCLDGYLRNSLGECVSIDECYNDPAGCNGDLNATRARDCGNPNPPTCENPEPEGRSDICVLNGCQCKQGYVVGADGNCIAANDCPGGSPICGANKTYVDCKFGCPTNYCPVDDSRAQVACSLAYPCQGGCACIAGHLIVSPEDPRCVLASDCPEVECTRQNEVWDPNPSGCFLERCDDRGSKCDYPYPSGPRCVCREGYYRNEDDVCIPALECPPLDCNGDFNATLKNCPDPCPKTCDDPEAGDSGCIEICLETDCQCNDGYFLTKIGGTCIKPEDCESCKGDPNAVYSYCPSACEPTCEKPDRNQVCTRQCMAPGCICRDGFVLNQETGKCIKPENCPNSACGGDPNAVYSTCPSACERTCENPDPQICTLQCLEPGCVCKPGYVKSAGGKCIKLEACPDSACGGDPNAVYSTCPSACERTCENPDPQICTLQCLEPGCVCKPGYVKSAGGKCIKLEACPADGCNGDRNATFNECPSYCPRTCDSQDSDRVCIAACAPRGCACNPGYVLTAQADGGKCVLPKDCPVKDKGCNGDLNATHSECPSFCPVTCENRHSEENVLCPAVCDPSFCVCKRGYLLTKKGGKCVKPEDCPVPGCNGDPNAEYKECPSACEPTCTNPDPEFCTKQCIPPGCVCKNGFVLNEETGTCVEREKCPDSACGGDPNAVYSTCPSACERTCANPDPQICTLQCLEPGCVCKPGYLKSARGKCIKLEACPAEPQCNGDRNATYNQSPSFCQATCKNPDPEEECMDMPMPPGCVCKSGFLRSKKGGKCLRPQDCPGGWPTCKKNETYVYCNVGCPTNYCPVDDSLAIIACDPPYPCPGGCACKRGYLMASVDDDRCILSSECPPVTCTRPNEVWDPYAPGCLHERCDDKDIPCDFQYPGPPRCRCIEGFYRNQDEICVPESECSCQIPEECKRTCAEPNPPNCVYNPPEENIDGCDCKDGYILSEIGGKCIPIDQCPPEVACNGDPNASPKRCPKPCPSTCESPNQLPCKRMCEPIACECKSGFLLSNNTETARCILPDMCPGGNPCGKTGRFVDCKVDCPYNYCPVDDSRGLVFCDPPAEHCLSGCICTLNHKRKSRDDPRCIVSSECPPVNCTRPNEKWSSCPSACLAENCEDVNSQPTVCNTLVLNCEPKCICKKNHFRNSSGICIRAKDCPPPGCGGDPNAVYSVCPGACPPTCSKPDPQFCTEQCLEPGCVCRVGFVLNEDTGKCVERENCPVPVCEDPNAVYKVCPSACEPTCANPKPEVCTDQCLSPSCVCKEGFVLNEKEGKCTEKNNCPDH